MEKLEKNYDQEFQLTRVQEQLIPGEVLAAVWDCKGGGSGFLGVTDRRLIYYDQGVLTKKKSLVSIPFNRIIGVGAADVGGMFLKSTELTILTAAGRLEFEFRGPDKAHWTNRYILEQILGQAHPQLPG